MLCYSYIQTGMERRRVESIGYSRWYSLVDGVADVCVPMSILKPESLIT